MRRFKNQELFNLWHKESSKNDKCSAIFDHVVRILKQEVRTSLSNEEELQEKIRVFCSNVSLKWQNVHRNINNFNAKYDNWLQSQTTFEILTSGTNTDITTLEEPSTSGRPRLSYAEKSLRSKRREAGQLLKDIEDRDPAFIVQAASMSARQKGQTDLAAILKEVNKSPNRPSKVRKMFISPKLKPIAYTSEEALDFINYRKQSQ